MHHFRVFVSLSLVTLLPLHSSFAAAEQTARMSVTVVATGSDSTRSEGEWSKGTFSYRAAFTTTLQSDGEPSDTNMYDPDYGAKALAAAAATMARIQAAQRGEFSDEEEAEPDNRYVFFLGEVDCPTTLDIEVDERLEGEYADVGGMQPYAITFTAKSAGTAPELSLLCVSSNSVLDIKDDVLYRSSLGFPEVTGHYLYQESNRGSLQDNPQSRHNALPAIVSDFVFDTLRVAPASGQLKTTLTPMEPVVTRINSFDGYEGSIEVELTWSFEVLE